MRMPDSSDDTSSESYCLQYFCSVTLPVFSRSEPSPLWQYVEQNLHQADSIRYVATALGYQHYSAANATTPATSNGSRFHLQAVQSLCQVIADAESRKVRQELFTIVFNCLLLVILECFRKNFDEMNIHLQHGLRIASQSTESCNAETTALLGESFRLLKQYSIAVALFNPLLPQDAISSGIVTASSNVTSSSLEAPEASDHSTNALLNDDRSLRDEEQNLLLDLFRTTVIQRRPQFNNSDDGGLSFEKPLEADSALVETVRKLQARHTQIEDAVQKRLHAKNSAQVERFRAAEARCMLVGIYLRCRWSGYACNYDQELATFQKILDKLEISLEYQMRDMANQEAGGACIPVFALNLNAVGTLVYTANMCRHAMTRRRAVALLSRCPQQEGPWNTGLATKLCRALIDFEERKAKEEGPSYTLTGFIPEHCRVLHYSYHQSGQSDQVPQKLRVFRRKVDDANVYIHEDLHLD